MITDEMAVAVEKYMFDHPMATMAEIKRHVGLVPSPEEETIMPWQLTQEQFMSSFESAT